jgi:hypothetical protein
MEEKMTDKTFIEELNEAGDAVKGFFEKVGEVATDAVDALKDLKLTEEEKSELDNNADELVDSLKVVAEEVKDVVEAGAEALGDQIKHFFDEVEDFFTTHNDNTTVLVATDTAVETAEVAA